MRNIKSNVPAEMFFFYHIQPPNLFLETLKHLFDPMQQYWDILMLALKSQIGPHFGRSLWAGFQTELIPFTLWQASQV